MQSKPSSFEPIWYSEPGPNDVHPFPVILFIADWHGKCRPWYLDWNPS
jgi:hypothetical protein